MSDSIADAVLDKSGIISFRFEQGNPEYRIQSVYKAQQATEGGICAALCCYWIIDHANGGSLWAQLYAIRSGSGGLAVLGINMSYAMRTGELRRRLMARLTSTRDFLNAAGIDPHSTIENPLANHILDPGNGKSALSDKRGFESEERLQNWLPAYCVFSNYMTKYAKVTIEEFGKRYQR